MVQIKAKVSKKVYTNPLNGFSIYRISILDFLDCEKCDKNIGLSCLNPMLEPYEDYIFDGELVFELKYGYTFKASKITKCELDSKDALVTYLSSEKFKGIGGKIAERIVDTLGLDCLKKIKENKDSLDQVKGLSKEKKSTVYKVLVESESFEQIFLDMYEMNISPAMAVKIYNIFKDEAVEIIKRNPYTLLEHEDLYISFTKCDEIASKIGFDFKSIFRIDSSLKYILLDYSYETGNTLIHKDDLLEKAIILLGFSLDDVDLISSRITYLIKSKDIYEFNSFLTHQAFALAEKNIAAKLQVLTKAKSRIYQEYEMDRLIKMLEESVHISYTDEQKKAIKNTLNSNVSIITGGPGTGKTTIEKGLHYLYTQLCDNGHDNISLCAPTGKAAKKIFEATNLEASTIHKLLCLTEEGVFRFNRFNPLCCDMLIVDEVSMIDTLLFSKLLDALSPDCKLILIGDVNQLPSIGPGQVLKDLIDSDTLTVSKLSYVHRQDSKSNILNLSYDILRDTVSDDDFTGDVSFFNIHSDDLIDSIFKTIDHFSEAGYSLYDDIQVLCPIYKGLVGIDKLNKAIQLKYNLNSESYKEEQKFFMGDKVIELTNDYELGVMNGENGVIVDVDDKNYKIDFSTNVIDLPKTSLDNINLAYTISVHKSQGSEYSIVILPIFNSYISLLSKKLLYTAITRAKKHLIILGSKSLFMKAIKINDKPRLTNLINCLKK